MFTVYSCPSLHTCLGRQPLRAWPWIPTTSLSSALPHYQQELWSERDYISMKWDRTAICQACRRASQRQFDTYNISTRVTSLGNRISIPASKWVPLHCLRMLPSHPVSILQECARQGIEGIEPTGNTTAACPAAERQLVCDNSMKVLICWTCSPWVPALFLRHCLLFPHSLSHVQ